MCSIIVISQLVRLSEVLVTFGLTVENILLPFLYLILPFVSYTIPIAFLFAVLITFGRLSADGEYTALLAAGYSLRRAAIPVFLVGAILYGAGAAASLNLEAWGRRELVQFFYRKTQTELDNLIKYKIQPGVFLDNFLGYVLYAEDISADRTRFTNVMLAPKAGSDQQDFTLLAPRGSIEGSVESGELRLRLEDGISFSANRLGDQSSVLKFRHADLDILRTFQEQILGSDSAEDDYRSYPPAELATHIDKLETGKDRSLYLRARFLLHRRIALPFMVIPFAAFGMVLGIADPRRGRSIAFIGAIAGIIAAYVIAMGFEWLSKEDYLSAPVAAWVPNVLLVLLSAFVLYQKNRLPPSEGIFDFRNFPGFAKHKA